MQFDMALSLLLVEDDEVDAEVVIRQLGKQAPTCETTHTVCLKDALESLNTHSYQVALLDLGLPDSTDLDGVKRLKQAAPHMPIVVLTGLDDQNRAAQALRAGAQDYLVKGKIDEGVLVRVIRYAIERQQAQDESLLLVEKVRKLSQAVEQSANMVIITDADGIIEYVNPKFCRITEYALADVMGKTPRILQSGCTSHKVYQELWETIKSGNTWHGELLNSTREGKLYWVLTSISPIYDVAGNITHFVATQEEVTQQKRIQEELAELNLNLEKRVEARTKELEDVNQELETFSYSVSHDLQAPLRSVSGFSKILLEDHAQQLNEDGRDYLNRVCAATKRMTNLISDMLDYSRQTRGEIKYEEVNLSHLAHNIVVELQEADPQREVHFEIAKDLICCGDRRMLRTMLTNLLANAWKFTRDSCPAQVVFGKTMQGDANVFFVRDNGAGFDAKHAQIMFDPFGRLHKADEFEGTGIGLSIVQRIVRRHGGWVWAESQAGKGATFYFSLDLTEVIS